MKTSNLVSLIIALIISVGGFEAINFLFMEASSGHQQPSVALFVRN